MEVVRGRYGLHSTEQSEDSVETTKNILNSLALLCYVNSFILSSLFKCNKTLTTFSSQCRTGFPKALKNRLDKCCRAQQTPSLLDNVFILDPK